MVQSFGPVATAVLCAALLAGCNTNTRSTSDGGGGTFTPVGSIALVPAAATLQVGDSLLISASVTAVDGGTLAGLALAWSTSNSTVATVDQSGKVVAVAVGEVDVAAAIEGVSASAHLKVVASLAGRRHTVTISISGSGSVTSSNSPISCTGAGGTCSGIFNDGDPLSLVAAPAASFFFGGWTGGGCGTASECNTTVSSDLNLTAAFDAGATLTVAVAGSGSVVSAPASIACPGTCASSFALGSSVRLTATASSGFAFAGWSGGGCSGTLPCTVALNGATSVNATFTAEPILTVTVRGAGTVTSDPPGIACVEGGGTCIAPFPAGTPIVLTEQPGTSLQFGGWGGACAGGASTCPLTLGASASATAQFGTFYPLNFVTSGNGTVSADSGALQRCGASGGVCTGLYLVGAQVVLTATPAAGAALSGWSGACSPATGSQCTLTMSAALSAGATFADGLTLSVLSGDAQSAPIDAALPLPVVVHLANSSSGANVPGATVTLAGPAGAAITPASASTDSQGNATFHVRLSRIVGTQTFTAKTQTASPLSLSAMATAPAPDTIFTVVNASHDPGLDGFPGAATTAHIRTPSGLALAADGTLYIADYDGNVVFALSPAGVLTLVAGTGACGNAGDGGAALAAKFCQVLDLALDETRGHRTLYLTDSASSVIRAIDLTLATPQITTFAGGGGPPGPGFGDGGPASQASLSVPARISVGPDGFLYIADTGRDRIRRVNLVTQIIENWVAGESAFCRHNACAVSWDASGHAFVTQTVSGAYSNVFRIDPGFAFTSIAGAYEASTSDGVYPTQAKLFAPTPPRFDGAGNLLLTEQSFESGVNIKGGHDVRRIDLVTGKINTVAGNGTQGYLGDYVPATQAVLNTPWTSVLDASGNLYVSDSGNSAVRLIWGAGQATPVRSSMAKTGGDQQTVGVDQITPAMQVTLQGPLGQPLAGYPVQWQSIDPGGVIFSGVVGTDNSGVAAADGRVGLVQGGTWRYTASAFDFHGDALAGSPITFQDTSGDLPAGYFFTAVNTSHVAEFSGIPGPATAAQIPQPVALAYSGDGTLYIATSGVTVSGVNFAGILALSPAGALTLVAGTGPCGYSGDGGPALAARLCSVTDLALDETHGRRILYLTDTQHSVVRAIDLLATPPTIETISGAGTATTTPFGDGALATEATLADPEHITVDPAGTFLYVSEYGPGRTRIRRIDLASGVIKAWLTIDDAFCAGSACKVAFSAPDQAHPNGMAFFSRGYGGYFFALYRADDPESPGANTAIAGQQSPGRFITTADGPAAGQYFFPGGLLVGPDGRLYLTDPYSMRVRVLSDLTASATMTTLAGTASTGDGPDGPVATSVALKTPLSVAFSPNGSLLVADSGNSAVREIWRLIH